MIQNLKTILKISSLRQIKAFNIDTKHFIRVRPTKFRRYIKNSDPIINELCDLIISQENCENWILLLENYKDQYAVQATLYKAIFDRTVTIHNLFLMLIQCKVLPESVWIPIQVLCSLQGDRDNELCCLIHYTTMNMGKRFQSFQNPQRWSRQKAENQMGHNFERVFNNSDISLQQKITILPMIIVLNNKNSAVLWEKITWLHNFPYTVLINLKANMRKMLEQRISEIIVSDSIGYFTEKMCIKSIQLLQVEGFISPKNLFAFAYQIYNISMILELLANYEYAFDKIQPNLKLQMIQFLVLFFDCIEIYQYDLDIGKDTKDLNNIKKIIVQNRLYLEQLNEIKFNQQLQNLGFIFGQSDCHFYDTTRHEKTQFSEPQPQGKKFKDGRKVFQGAYMHQGVKANANRIHKWLFQKKEEVISNKNSMNLQTTSLAKLIPRLSSQFWFYFFQFDELSELATSRQRLNEQKPYQSLKNENYRLVPQKAEQKIAKFCNEDQQSILTHILNELYHLKTDYLPILYEILRDCYQKQEQVWSEVSMSFYKLQLYLVKNHLIQFLVYNFNSIQTKNSPIIMLSYYGILSLVLRSNPISYGKIDRIIYTIQQQRAIPKGEKDKKQQKFKAIISCSSGICEKDSENNRQMSMIQYFAKSFIQNIELSKSSILMILTDQFEWKENEIEDYDNCLYQSLFVRKVVQEQRVEWMVSLIENVVLIYTQEVLNRQHDLIEGDSLLKEKRSSIFESITFLLAIYYYFEETVQIEKKKKQEKIRSEEKRQCNKSEFGRERQLQRTFQSERGQEKIKIKAPKKAYLDKMFESEKFLEKLYPIKIRIQAQSTKRGLDQNEHSYKKRLSMSQQQRILNILVRILDQWEGHYNSSSKSSILKSCLSYPMLRVFKKKLKNRINGFVKIREYQQNGEQFYSSYYQSRRTS